MFTPIHRSLAALRNWNSDRNQARSETPRRRRRNGFKPFSIEPLETRRLLAVLYADQVGDYTVTTDQGTIGVTDAGDTVTWNGPTPVPGLIFGTSAFGTIAAAIAAATPGDEVNVAAGVFAESLVIDKALSLFGARKDIAVDTRTAGAATETVIDATAAATAISITASNVTVNGFDIRGDEDTEVGVRVNAGINTLTGITITRNFIHGMANESDGDGIESFGILADAKGPGGVTFGSISGLSITGNSIFDLGGASQAETTSSGPGGTVTSQGVGVQLAEIDGATAGAGATITGNAFGTIRTGVSAASLDRRGIGILVGFDGLPTAGGVSTGVQIASNEYDNVEAGVFIISDETTSVTENVADFTNNIVMVTNAGAPSPGRAVVTLNGATSRTNDLTIDGYLQAQLDAANFDNADGYLKTRAEAEANSNAGATIQTTPIAVNDTATANEDTSVTFNVLDNDSDPDDNTLTLTAVADPANGTVTFDGATGSVTFDPDDNFNGVATFSYTISDGQGGTATGSISVTVTAVNDPPVAVADTATTTTGNPVAIDVLDNDTDAENDTLTVQPTITGLQASQGTAVVNPDGTITFTPAAGFLGTATFTYEIRDPSGGSSSAQVSVTVANTAPVAVADTFLMTGTSLSVGAPGVLDNDTDADTSQTLTASIVTNTTEGTLTLNANGSFTFTPNSTFDGEATFTYKVNDGTADSAAVTVTIEGQNFLFVRHLYEDLLGRPGSLSEINAWVDKLDDGDTRGEVIDGIRGTTEYRRAIVNGLYTTLLSRTGETAGVNFWVDVLARGFTRETVMEGFMKSPEYFTLAGGQNQQFVTEVYRDLLGSTSDTQGIAFWTSQLGASSNVESRRLVAEGIMHSDQFATVSIERNFQRFLDRASDAAGRNFWLSQFDNDDFLDEFEFGFLNTAEYFGKA